MAFCHFYGNILEKNCNRMFFYWNFSHQLIDLLNKTLIFANLIGIMPYYIVIPNTLWRNLYKQLLQISRVRSAWH